MLTKDNLIPSSSLILARDSNNGVEVFLMKRAQKSNFGGVWVFPGGILEKLDQVISINDYCTVSFSSYYKSPILHYYTPLNDAIYYFARHNSNSMYIHVMKHF